MKMKAVGFKKYLPIQEEESLVDIEVEMPVLEKPRDLLVEIQAISVNPVDTKVRGPKEQVETDYRIIGWDAAGIVREVGEACRHFQVGDEVFYAGAFHRSGTNAQFQLVDERLVGRKPASLSFEESAALPLTSLTAWESLFDRMGIDGADKGKSLLIINGAGGVGSMAIQLGKQAGLTVIASASRKESSDWVTSLGADYVVNHRKDLVQEVQAAGFDAVDFILCLHSTDRHWDSMCELIAPEGKICSIVETEGPVDIGKLKNKSVTFAWEFMFTRAQYETADMEQQHVILTEVAKLFDEGRMLNTLTKTYRPIHAANLRKAHELLESGRSIGKVVLADF